MAGHSFGNYQSFCLNKRSDPLASPELYCIFRGPPARVAPLPPGGSSATRESSVATDRVKKRRRRKEKKTVASRSALYLTDHRPRRTMRLETSSEWHLNTSRAGELRAKYLLFLFVAEANLSYKQILLIQYSILKDWPLVNPREERSINKLSQGLLILWFPQTLNCRGERQGRARGWVLTPDLYPSESSREKMEAGRGLWSAVIVERCWSQDAAFLLD